MKILLPESVAKQLRGPLADCRDNGELSPSILAGQVMRGDFDNGGVDKIFLFLAKIRPGTARRIRKLIQAEREKERNSHAA